jgi:6-phosphogluconolactonase (cycloisomerase 2 family)
MEGVRVTTVTTIGPIGPRRAVRRPVRLALLTLLASLAVTTTPARAQNQQGNSNQQGDSNAGSVSAVFVGTNHNHTQAINPSEPANQVAMFRRAADGTLTLLGYFDTGGQGSGPSVRFAGDGLGAAHSVQLSIDQRWLFVTNAGSNDLSVFRVSSNGLQLTDRKPTGGVFPNSVAQYGNRVYVLNAAGNGSITGFTLGSNGTLTPLSQSTRTLGANQDPVRPDPLFCPSQLSFTPDGRQLVVAIKDGPAPGALPGLTPTGPGRVLVFSVDASGRPSASFTQTNLSNLGPFGFSFDGRGKLLVALFVGGPSLTGAAGSFGINPDGTLTPITPVVPNGRLATGRLENNGRYAFASNYTSGDLSSYTIGPGGSLTLLQSVAGSTANVPFKVQGSTPVDLGISPNGRFLYVVLPGSGKVAGWRINADGSLTKLDEFGGLPETVNGDSAPFEFGPGGSPAGIAVL